MATHALSPAVPAYRGGLYEWLTTTDHKKIGIMYLINSFLMFFIGGDLRPAGPGRAGHPRAPDLHERARLQRVVLDPRDGDDLPVHHPDAGGPRELRRAADDRRAGHGLPADQRAVVLDAAAGRGCCCWPASSYRRRRGGRRLDELPAADGGDGPLALARRRARTCGSCRSSSSARARSWAASTSWSRSSRCARRG